MDASRERHDLAKQVRRHAPRARGFTLIEILLGITILVIGILGAASMFGTGYTNVAEGGRMTMAVTAARQMLEDVRTIPFGSLPNLNGPAGTGFNTNSPGSQPASDPERNIARKWRYALAGDGTGWNFTSAEKARWQSLGVGSIPFGASGQITVVNQTATLRLITVTVQIPGRGATVQLATLISAGIGP
jgi:prepilin-type N-terminal cleavage/methylation domain-containing protein